MSEDHRPADEASEPRRDDGAWSWADGATAPLLAGAAAAAGLAVYHEQEARRAERRHPPLGRLLDVDGVKVHVYETGQGEPLVLINGNGTMVEDWLTSGLVDRLRKRYRVIAIDRPGYGHTERPRSTLWTASAQADLIRKTLQDLGVEDPIVVGHSWGTLVAMTLGLDHPDDVRGLVLLSGYYFPTGRVDVWAFATPAIPVVGDVMRYTVSPLVGRLIAPKLVRKMFAPLPVPARFETGFPLDMALRPSQLRASGEDSGFMVPNAAALQDRYRDLQVPVAILTGTGDEIVTPQRQSIRLHGEIPGSTLGLVRGVGHMVHYSAHNAIADCIDDVARRSGTRPTDLEEMEASPGIEPGYKDLQSSA